MVYNNPYQQNYQPQYFQQQMPQMPQQQNQQMQSGGFMSVRNEQEARNYPVAPGNVMTFKIENQPYVCEKAQGFSQLEGPVFNKYRLVKEEDVVETTQEPEPVAYDDSEIRLEIADLKSEIVALKKKLSARSKPLATKKIEEEDYE